MDTLLPFLLIPLLAGVAGLPEWRGQAAARVIIATFALATLQLATGSLEPGELRRWAAQGASQQLFISLSIGIAVGGLGLWAPRGWWWYLSATPLGAGLLWVAWHALRIGPLLLGVVLGALPLLLAGLAPWFIRATRLPASAPRHWPEIVITIAAIVAVATRSLTLIAVAPLLHLLRPERRTTGRCSALAVGATLILGALTLYASSLTATPMSVLTSMGFPLPVSGTAERVIGAAVLAAAILMVAPWPLHRFGAGTTLVPAAMLMVCEVAGSIAPLGVAGWLSLAAIILVPSAIAAAWRGHWAIALGSAAIVAVPRPGWPAFALVALISASLGALAAGNLHPFDRISFPTGVLAAVLLTAAMALTAAAVLTHEVVLGVLLTAGLAAAAARPVRHLPL